MTRISCSVGRHSLWSMSLVVAMGTIGESAIAGDPGSVAVTVGPIGVNPHSRSGTLHITEVNGQSVDVEQPGTGVSVSKTESVAVTAAYALTNALWIQAVGAWPVDEDLRGTGLLSNQGVIGKGQQLSPALLLKCDFSLLGNALRPFVSAGVNYTTFRKTRIVNDTFRQQTYGPNSQVSASASSSVNPVVNVGADIAVDPHWFLNGVVVYAPIRTRITVRAEDTAFGTIKTRTDVRLKSIGYGLNLGYTFSTVSARRLPRRGGSTKNCRGGCRFESRISSATRAKTSSCPNRDNGCGSIPRAAPVIAITCIAVRLRARDEALRNVGRGVA